MSYRVTVHPKSYSGVWLHMDGKTTRLDVPKKPEFGRGARRKRKARRSKGLPA